MTYATNMMGVAQNIRDLLNGTLPACAFNASVAVTRPADTSAYLANDVIGSATGSTAGLTFSSVAPATGGVIRIIGCSLRIDAVAVISGETSYDLHLYSVTPPSALGDNAAWDLPSGDRASYLGKQSLGTPLDIGSTLFVETNGLLKPVKAAGANLYGYLVTVGPYTPTSSRVYTANLFTQVVG